MPSAYDLLTAGISTRQVEYWTRLGYLRPDRQHPGSGNGRTWPDIEVQVGRTMARLVKAGLNVHAAHTVARGHPELAPGVRVLVDEVTAGG